jgi:hypothetical protein
MCSDGHYTGDDIILPRHAGSTIMALDVDFDGDKDAWVGDISSKRLVFLLNGLSADQAWITEQDSQWPSLDTAVYLPFFAAGYSVQLDDDPEPEFLAAVNSRSLTEDQVSVWRYDEDPFTDGPYVYTLEEKGFFQKEMSDMGSHTRPAIADVTGDGLPDLVIGGFRYADETLTRIPSLWLFENQGSSTQPYFVRVSDDYLNMSQYGSFPTFEYAPAFGDMDGNGTTDLIVGDQNGKLFFYKNTAASGEAMSFEPVVYPYMDIAVGVSATPQIVDINGDGRGDLIIGERTGNTDNSGRCSNLNYFENVGPTGSALFNPDPKVAPNTQCFGRVLFDIQIGLPQYSTPAVVRTKEGLILLTGSDLGDLLLYTDLQNGKTGSLTLLDDEFGSLDVGNRSAPALADLNSDGKFELIVGNQRGGLELFGTDLEVGFVSVEDPVQSGAKPYHIDGTMGRGILDVTMKEGYTAEVIVYDISGRLIQSSILVNESRTRIDLQQQPSGVYLLQIKVDGEMWAERVVKK